MGIYLLFLHTFDPAALFLGIYCKIIMYVRQILIQRNITKIFLLKLKNWIQPKCFTIRD